jgi:predicted dienelactone hydrolase
MRLVGSTAFVLLAATAPSAVAQAPVGHRVENLVVPGSATPNEQRKVPVHLWYPANPATAASQPKTVYKSALHAVPVPAQYTPLSWTVEAELAREGAAIDPAGKPFPVLVFSHGNTNDPIDYAPTLERIAAGGFVVAAPSHTNNTQDDTRIDFFNTLTGVQPMPCNDGRAGPCSRTNIPFSMADRASDVSAVLSAFPGWFGTRVDAAKAGVLGHSRGTLTALSVAGGSAPPPSGPPTCGTDPARCWPLAADPRVQAVMGMAIGQQPISLGVNYQAIRVPTLLVSAALDAMSPPSVSDRAFRDLTGTADKQLVSIPKAVHRTFDSNYCDEMTAAGRIAQADPKAVLDKNTFDRIVTSPNSGWGTDYCAYASFAGIEAFTRTATTSPALPDGFTPTPTNVPASGLDTDVVKEQMAALAIEFFGAKLARASSGTVGGTVPATLALTLGGAASLGAFVPGVDRTYDGTTTATVTSSAGSATLSITDTGANPGRLVNGTAVLGEALQARAGTAAYAALSGVPLTLNTYDAPVANNTATIGFRQHIAANQALRTGNYAKTLTFTLATASP